MEAFGGAYRVQDSSYPVLQLVPPSSEYWPTIVICPSCQRKGGVSPLTWALRPTDSGSAQSFELLTNAMRLLSGDQPGVFIEPWPP